MTFLNFEVVPFFQKILDLKSKEAYAYEVLLRGYLDGHILPANDVLTYANRVGFWKHIDLLVVEKTFQRFDGTHRLFFNVSPKNLTSNLLSQIMSKAEEYGVCLQNIVIEITERQALRDLKYTEKLVKHFRDLGFSFAIDDFGSGYASLLYVKHLPIDYLKIDGDYVKALPYSLKAQAIVKAVLNLAKELGVKLVAECVENQEIFSILEQLGVDLAQGYYIEEPKSLLK